MAQYYTFKHDKSISAIISYPWKKDALILNKTNVVICTVEKEQVEKSKSWIKNKKK